MVDWLVIMFNICWDKREYLKCERIHIYCLYIKGKGIILCVGISQSVEYGREDFWEGIGGKT